MELFVINTGFFKLDGGAMFGVVPKSLWSRTNPPDENNLCTWAMRCLLIKEGERILLLDTGLGDKQDEKFLSHYHLHGDSLEESLYKAGFHPDEITDVFLTHLHFDHVGGATFYNEDKSRIIPRFKNAVYWSNEEHWKWAKFPNDREKASFLKENLLPLEESGQLRFLKEGESPIEGMTIHYANGHTEKQMIPYIQYKDKTIVFVADLLPSLGHIPLPWIMSYDVRPLVTLKEKKEFLDKAVENSYIIFFEHDPVHECCTLKHTEKGVRADRTFALKDIL